MFLGKRRGEREREKGRRLPTTFLGGLVERSFWEKGEEERKGDKTKNRRDDSRCHVGKGSGRAKMTCLIKVNTPDKCSVLFSDEKEGFFSEFLRESRKKIKMHHW